MKKHKLNILEALFFVKWAKNVADGTILCSFILCQPQTAWKSTIFIHDKYSVVNRPISQKSVKCARFIWLFVQFLWLTF